MTILFVTTFISIEPVNIPKMLTLSITAFSALGILITRNLKNIFSESKFLISATLMFTILGGLDFLLSDSSAVQNLYGIFGRNTGYLTYTSLCILMIGCSLLRENNSYQRLINAILFAGLFNVVYCAFAYLGHDFLKWNNTYGKILGTLGNPDFVAAFLGIYIGLALPFMYSKSTNLIKRIILICSMPIALFEINRTGALQGMLVALAGFAIFLFFLIKSSMKSKAILWAYVSTLSISGVLLVLGMLQKGPLTSIVYKTSVSLRGVYWNAGINMGMKNPITGKGFDAYGDYYRELRSAKAMVTPGPGTVSNVAHNVPIDIFVTGAFPLIASYLLILIIGFRALVILVKRNTHFDPILVALSAGWIGYEIQSIVSINQIGLAICGWTLTGLLVGYEYSTRDGKDQSPTGIRKTNVNVANGILFALVGAIIGFLIALPPFAADISWRNALNKGDATQLIKVAEKWPKDIYRMNQITSALEQNQLFEQSILVARKSVEFNPRSFDAWYLLSRIQNSTPQEKELAVSKMKALDPRNIELVQ